MGLVAEFAGELAVALTLTGQPGRVITATATAVPSGSTAANLTSGDTSEFSAAVTAS